MQCGVSPAFGSGYSLLLGGLWQYTSMNCEDKHQLGATQSDISSGLPAQELGPLHRVSIYANRILQGRFCLKSLFDILRAISCGTTTPVLSDLSYNLNQPGYLLSITGEYFLPLPPPATVVSGFGAISSDPKAVLTSALYRVIYLETVSGETSALISILSVEE